jgi:hypothetical protein
LLPSCWTESSPSAKEYLLFPGTHHMIEELKEEDELTIKSIAWAVALRIPPIFIKITIIKPQAN